MTVLQFMGKRAGETRLYRFDFASLLTSGETLSTATCTATVYTGTDASPSAIISGSESISGSEVSQAVTGGTAGNVYNLTMTVTTSGSQTLSLEGPLVILPESV